MKVRKLYNSVLGLYSLIIILMIISSTSCYSQPISYDIYLKKVTTNKIKSGFDYQLVNQKDTTFITIKYNGDFGLVNSAYFVEKDKLPDGEYKIYVDEILRKVFYFKNDLKENLWVEYRVNGEKQITPFSKGKIRGSIFEYFNNGDLKSKSCFSSKGIKRRISYNNSGVVKMKEYFRENKQYKIKKFDTNGKLIETKKITI